MNKLKSFFSPLVTSSNYNSELSKAIYADVNTIEKDYLLKNKMAAIQKFYDYQFKNFCILKRLDLINELCTRKIELEDTELINPISLLTSVLSGIVGSVGMYFLSILFDNGTLISIYWSFSLGAIIFIYGTIFTHYFYYRGKTLNPRRQVLRQFELELVSKHLDEYVEEIRKEIKST